MISNATFPAMAAEPWSFALEITAIVVIGLVVLIGIQASRGKRRWLEPSWFQNPFIYNQPLFVFDAGSYYILAVAVGGAVLGMSRTPRNWAWELFLSMGAGLWIGTRLCVIAFRGRFQDADSPST